MVEETPTKDGAERRGFVGTILTSVIGGFFGGGASGLLAWLQREDHRTEIQRAQILEVVKLTTDLDSKKIEAAPDYIQILYESGNIDQKSRDQLLVIVARRASDTNPQVIAKVLQNFPQSVNDSSELKASVAPGHARVFFHISREEQRTAARGLQADLTKASSDDGDSVAVVQGIELVPSYVGTPQVRYFFTGDKTEAEKLVQRLSGKLRDVKPVQIGGYETKSSLKPQLFEVWLGGWNA